MKHEFLPKPNTMCSCRAKFEDLPRFLLSPLASVIFLSITTVKLDVLLRTNFFCSKGIIDV